MIINILIGLIVIGVTVTIQAYGTHFWLIHIDKKYTHLPESTFVKKSIRLLIFTAFFLLSLHFIEASVWAFVYRIHPGIEEFESFEKAIYFSFVTFTTLGYGEITIGSSNRLLAGFEAINGILLIGWSTAFMFSLFQIIWEKMNKIEYKNQNKNKTN